MRHNQKHHIGELLTLFSDKMNVIGWRRIINGWADRQIDDNIGMQAMSRYVTKRVEYRAEETGNKPLLTLPLQSHRRHVAQRRWLFFRLCFSPAIIPSMCLSCVGPIRHASCFVLALVFVFMDYFVTVNLLSRSSKVTN